MEVMTRSEPAQPGPAAQAAGDALAERLRAVQRLLCTLDMNPDVRLRLQLRYAAICTSLKLPSADRDRGAERLDRLIADAELQGRKESRSPISPDNAEPNAPSRDYL